MAPLFVVVLLPTGIFILAEIGYGVEKPGSGPAVVRGCLPTRQYALSGVLGGCAAGDLGVQMTWISPVFPGQDHNSDVTDVTI